jgi:hypothetical protein
VSGGLEHGRAGVARDRSCHIEQATLADAGLAKQQHGRATSPFERPSDDAA